MKIQLLMAAMLLCAYSSSIFAQVRTGADILIETKKELVAEKRIALVTNHSAVLSSGQHLADALMKIPGTRLAALFGPEHGIRGNAPDGRSISHGIDSLTGVPVYSLYGKISKPTKEMLKDVDIMIYDIQDVGARFYTFISTLFLIMESAAENNIPIIVLDRPNPIGGEQVEGPIRLDSLKSFVGWAPIPAAHGLTVGELAMMANGEGWLANAEKADILVIPMDGWKRNLWFDQSGLRWIKPSPNMMTLRTAAVYPGTCLFEATNLSEGRGTDHPFEYIGAPWADGALWSKKMNGLKLPGVIFEPVIFTPIEIPDVASKPKYADEKCSGVFVKVTDRLLYHPFRTAVFMLAELQKIFPEKFVMSSRRMDLLAGNPLIRDGVTQGVLPQDIILQFERDEKKFTEARKKYLLYR